MGNVSERYRQFFQRLIDELREKHGFTRARKAQTNPGNGQNFASGYGGVHYWVNFGRDREVMVGLSFEGRDPDWNHEQLVKLLEYKEEIESELGRLIWNRWKPSTHKTCGIIVVRPGSIDDDAGRLVEIHDWVVDELVGFKRAFDPYLRELAGGG